MKKIAEDIMIPYVCTKNHNHFGVFFAVLPHGKKTHWDITILHIYTIHNDYMLYGSWDMEHNGQKFLSF